MMPDCKHIIHPFQTDPGTSQGQRVLDDLLGGKAKVDNRSLADLLDFFVQLSRHVNYYDENLQVSDWQPFFAKSLPFVLASIVKYDRTASQKKLNAYKARFYSKPSKEGLYLLLRYTYTNIIKKIDNWDRKVTGSGIPIETVMEKLMKDKLSGPLKNFIKYSNAASNWLGVSSIRLNDLVSNPAWALVSSDLYQEDDSFKKEGNTKRKRLIALYNKVFQLVQTFHDAIRLLSVSAEQSLDQSLLPLKEELKEKHPPHLAILFAFIKLFQYLQGDLNGYSKKHLDFFFKQVLQIKPKGAVPDKVHLVLDIQQQLDKYLFKKGLLFKDGKDNNKAEIYFASDDEIVVNKAQIVDQRTLFINNKSVKVSDPLRGTCDTKNVAEGIYIAPDATKANGIDKEFKDGLPSRATLGDKWSKYIDPENKFIYPYPNARLGFILASPVLLLNEGTRTINISLSCQLQKDYCNSLIPQIDQNNPCCDNEQELGVKKTAKKKASNCPPFYSTVDLFTQVSNALSLRYYYISQPLIAALVKKGISKELKAALQDILIVKHLRADKVTGKTDEIVDPNVCFCGWEEKLFDRILPATVFEPLIGQPGLEIIKDIIYPRHALNVVFSGEKEWIAPLADNASNLVMSITQNMVDDTKFVLNISVIITPEQKAITFYNAEALKEDFNTTMPLVKLELDDKIKIQVPVNDCEQQEKGCCDRILEGNTQEVSLYHFFREVKVTAGSKIDVQVCGLKNFVVQNDESLQDVNAPIYPFGTRPTVIGFDLVNPVKTGVPKNLVGPSFYIGSKEVFCKSWNDVYVNLSWKNKPVSFNEYYKAYLVDKTDQTKYGLTEDDFQLNISLLEEGKWKKEKKYTVPNPPPANNLTQNLETHDFNRPLFRKDATSAFCKPANTAEQTIHVAKDYIDRISSQFRLDAEKNGKLEAATQNGFLKLNLQNQDFLHKDYAYVLARQMMALGKFPDSFLEDASYTTAGGTVIVFGSTVPKIVELDQLATDNLTEANKAKADALLIEARANQARLGGSPGGATITNNEFTTNPDLNTPIQNAKTDTGNTSSKASDLRAKLTEIEQNLKFWDFLTGKPVDKLSVLIPNEPWTPIISNISLDYTATATSADIDLIHLYPFPGTYKANELVQHPMLFPTFCDEGTFFIGFQNLVPGSTLSILFQLSEATADSESERESLVWYYLENNEWKLLREGFEVLNDDTDGLTTSGIIKFSMPANMTSENSILPKGLHWIKACIPCKSKSVAEIIGIYTQAVKASFTNEEANDKLRLEQPLEAGAVAKLKVADASVKKVLQPYDSFGGRKPEEEGHFYIRVSELLRHKNRAIQKFDYERLLLESFPTIFKAKCINHTYALDAGAYINDFTMAPGYVLVAVIPDLNQLKAAKSFEPKVPVSLLEQIEAYLKKVTSPFVRLKIMNPRYEKVNICIRVKLLPDKDEVYYKEQLAEDIRTFLAPWAIGEFEKLSFGQPVSQSDMIRFLESRDYIDYIIDLRMAHEMENVKRKDIIPVTARSILVAGSVDVCIDQPGCETWCICGDPAGNNNDQPCCDHPPVPVREEPEIILT